MPIPSYRTGPPVIGALPLAALRPVIHQFQLRCESLEPMAPAGIVGGRNGSGSVVAVVMIIEDEDQVRVLVESVPKIMGTTRQALHCR